MLVRFAQGIAIGVAMVLPGLSAGTVILIMGFYITFLADLSSLRLKPYLPLFAGAGVGGLAAVYTVGLLLDRYNSLIMALICGMLIASLPAVVHCRRLADLKILPLVFAAAGFFLTWTVLCDPGQTFTVLPPGGYFHFFLGGALASATMLLPGISGSAMLVIVNLYDDVITAVSQWQWIRLIFLGSGFAVGLLALARLLSALYRRYRSEISFLLGGLILGSTRALLPETFSTTFLLAAAAGAALVLFLTRSSLKKPF